MNKAIADNTGQSVAGAFLRFFPAMPVTLFFLFSLLPVLLPAQGLPVIGTGTGIKGAGISHIDPYSPKVFYFPFGSSGLLRDYADNRRMFEALDSLLRTEEIVSSIDTVQILAGCSPAGSEGYNQELARKRARSMYSYLLLHHGNIAENCPVDVRPVGIDWQGYGVLLRSKLGLGYKQMWDLLQYASVRLKMKDGSYIPKGSSSPLQRLAEDTLTSLPSLPESVYRHTIYIYRDRPVLVRDTIYIDKEKEKEQEKELEAFLVPDTLSRSLFSSLFRKPFRLVVKTNMLYDLALLPNVSVEAPFAGDWSAVANLAFSKWDSKSPAYWSHQVNYAGLEIRRWWGNRHDSPLLGHFAGLYFTGGVYDLRLFTKSLDAYGYLSPWSWSAGATYGYSLPLSTKMNLEFSLNAGYFTGAYSAYNRSRCTDCYPERQTGRRGYWGPTGGGVSLVYKIK
ncbi:MAG: DUF3575 domain-containing protein [Prevotella sp.]|nr:DUF3575 domain-containing protein [Prevotella sp.]